MTFGRFHFLAANAVASIGGIGFIRLPLRGGIPFGGTVASAAAAVAAYAITRLGGIEADGLVFAAVAVAATAIVTLAGLWAAHFACRGGEKDPKRVVIDEWAGVWATLLFLPVEWYTVAAAFLIFRVLDISKPLGIKRLEKLPGGVGIMLDDVGAGLLGAAILNAGYWGGVLIRSLL